MDKVWSWKERWAFEGQQLPIAVITAEEDVQGNEWFPAQVTSWCCGGIPIVHSIGDCHQQPVGMKPIWDLSDPSSPHSAYANRLWLTFHKFLSSDSWLWLHGWGHLTENLPKSIQEPWNGNVTFDITTYFMNRSPSKLSPEDALLQEKVEIPEFLSLLANR